MQLNQWSFEAMEAIATHHDAIEYGCNDSHRIAYYSHASLAQLDPFQAVTNVVRDAIMEVRGLTDCDPGCMLNCGHCGHVMPLAKVHARINEYLDAE